MDLFKIFSCSRLLVVTTTVNQDWINNVCSSRQNLLCINAGITNFPKNIPNNLCVVRIPLSFLKFRAYSFFSKIQVIIVELEVLVICLIAFLNTYLCDYTYQLKN